jgi:hypothetical protein
VKTNTKTNKNSERGKPKRKKENNHDEVEHANITKIKTTENSSIDVGSSRCQIFSFLFFPLFFRPGVADLLPCRRNPSISDLLPFLSLCGGSAKGQRGDK